MSHKHWVLILLFGLVLFLPAASPPSETPTPAVIHLQYATFDPLLDGIPPVPANLSAPRTAPDVPGLYIVQFEGIIPSNGKTALTNLGAVIASYLPENAFLVRLTPAAATAAAQLNGVRWVGDFQPAYKLSPRITPNTIQLRLKLASWANAATVKDTLAAMGIAAGGDGNVLIIDASAAQLPAIAQLPDVLWIEPFSIPTILNDQATSIMKVDIAWNLGYTGAGQIVTIADTGIDTGVDDPALVGDIHLDFDNRMAHISSWAVPDVPTCYGNATDDDGAADKNSGHGTHVSGSVGGNGTRSNGTIKGVAYGATLTMQAVEQWTTYTGVCASYPDGYYLSGIPSDLRSLFLESYAWGARIHTNSWGSSDSAEQGVYTLDAQNADQFIWAHPDFTILFAMGNQGTDANHDGYVDEGSIGPPATAKNVISIGASDNVRASGGYQFQWGSGWSSDYQAIPTSSDYISDNADEMAAFSSRGPTNDGRIKPDLVAPGTNILSTKSSQSTNTGWGPYNDYYMYNGGTSMATPLAAGAATVLREYLVKGAGISNPSAALVKAVLINTAVDIGGYGDSAYEAGQPIPNNHEGWGRIDIAAAISNTGRIYYDTASLSTGNSDTYTVTITGTVSALKTTLVWSDYPGNSANTGTQLVNNLNLIVTAPNGSTTYLGNVFSGGWSTTGGSADTVNNVENVYVKNPAIGTWTIQVSGASVPQGPQPYALVVDSGKPASPPPVLNRSVYLPLILKNAGGSGPAPGFWESATGDEFYVTTDRGYVNNFAVYISVNGCGSYKITHSAPEAIANNQFSFTGSFYASGTFATQTTASGTDGLSNFNIPNCGSVSGGPWSWNATWKNNTQPRILNATLVKPDDGEIPQRSDITVIKLP